MIIILAGPDKAGKTTLIKEVIRLFQDADIPTNYRHWGKPKIDDREYSPALQEDYENRGTVHIWDRGWPCEYVYSNLLRRGTRLAHDPWLGEWLHARAVDLKYIVLPYRVKKLVDLKSPTDMPVNSVEEYRAYSYYASRFHWPVIRNFYTETSLKINAAQIFEEALKNPEWPSTGLCGAKKPDGTLDFLVVRQFEEKEESIPGAWLPFTGPRGIAFARKFGDTVFGVTWADDFKSVLSIPSIKKSFGILEPEQDMTLLLKDEMRNLWNTKGR